MRNMNYITSFEPDLTKPAPYLIRGNPVFLRIPASAGMSRYDCRSDTCSVVINDAVYKSDGNPTILVYPMLSRIPAS